MSRELQAGIRLSGGPNRQKFQWDSSASKISQGDLTKILEQIGGIEVYKNCRAGGEHECDFIVLADEKSGASESALKAAGDAKPISLPAFIEMLSTNQLNQFKEMIEEWTIKHAPKSKQSSGKKTSTQNASNKKQSVETKEESKVLLKQTKVVSKKKRASTKKAKASTKKSKLSGTRKQKSNSKSGSSSKRKTPRRATAN